MSIPLSSPDIAEEDINAVVEVLRTRHLSLGPKLAEFEEAMAKYIGTKHAVAVSSGTAALHLCIRALGITEGDEVITTPFSFIASSNCILFEHATVRFVDVLPDTLCIDPAQVEAAITPKTKAILAVDIFGYLADWSALRDIAERHNLALLEDSCEAIGSRRGDVMAGAFADCGTFAFYPNKQMTTGEGGMMVTNRDDIAEAARMQRNQGRNENSAWLDHPVLGFNYRISDINCALGISQLNHLPDRNAKRSRVASWYGEKLASLKEHLHVPSPQEGVDISWFVYVVRLADKYTAKDCHQIIEYLRKNGIGCSNYFPCIHLQKFYKELYGYKGGEFPIAESISDRSLALPFSSLITEEEVAQIASILENYFSQASS